ncbi:MAG: hypothetical protein COZ94_04075 [Nitrospirae bacterium CG_4_8_14_3_um_filter_41_47]|nr:MAG: hypothetical protein COZ94_04075 [Nitrospirae bacterium CG_4_8_14_3_um_filter_41_47]
MSPVLKIDRYNGKKEIIFELKFQMSLTTHQRFEMMFKKTEEMKKLLEKSGYRKAFEIVKRTGSIDSENLEDSKILSEIKKLTKGKKKN